MAEMMQSIALAANMEVDDYVIVDDMEASAFESESYDYCDEEFSERSSYGKAEPSHVDPSASLYDSLVPDVPEEVNCPNSSSLIAGVNEVCYEAMRLSENQVHDWTSSRSHRESHSILSENLLDSFMPNESDCPISSSMVEGLDNVHQEALYLLEKESQDFLSNHSRKEDHTSHSAPASSSGEETSSEDNTSDHHGTLEEQALRQGSRKSNKKRRKHSKLMRKAAAAAAAAAAISELTRNGTNSPGKKKAIAGGGRLTKRVANIAVACAAESIAHYKAGHLVKGKKAF
jgi:hypothetical protein